MKKSGHPKEEQTCSILMDGGITYVQTIEKRRKQHETKQRPSAEAQNKRQCERAKWLSLNEKNSSAVQGSFYFDNRIYRLRIKAVSGFDS